jgi:hypothetical protein
MYTALGDQESLIDIIPRQNDSSRALIRDYSIIPEGFKDEDGFPLRNLVLRNDQTD